MQNPASTQQPPLNTASDEVNFIDLWLSIYKWKKLILIVLGASIVIGISTALLTPKRYTFSTIVEIGGKTSITDNALVFQPIESIETVKSKIESAYLPLALDELGLRQTNTPIPNVRINSPKGGETLIIQSDAPIKKGELVTSIHQKTIDLLMNNHTSMLAPEVALLEQSISNEQRKLDAIQEPAFQESRISAAEAQLKAAMTRLVSLQEEKTDLDASLVKLNQYEQTIQNEVSATRESIKKIDSNRTRDNKTTVDPVQQMLVDSQVIQLQNRLNSLEQQRQEINITKTNEIQNRIRENLQGQEATKADIKISEYKLITVKSDLNRETSSQRENLSKAKTMFESLRKTKVIAQTSQSIKSITPSISMLTALSIFLGIFASLFAALIAELREKVLMRMRETKESKAITY